MGRPIDLVTGNITFSNTKAGMLHKIADDLEDDRCAGWQAFYKKDYENEELRGEIARLKVIIRQLKARKK